MGYLLMWVESLAGSVLLVAAATAWAARWHGRRRQVAVPVALGVLIFLKIAALTAGAVYGAYLLATRPVWIAYTALWAAVYVAAAAVILVRGLRRRDAGEPAARKWPAGRLAVGAVVVMALHVMTFWNMDLAAELQLAGLRAEGGALALSVAPARVPDRANAALVYQKAFDSINRFEGLPAEWGEVWSKWAMDPPGARRDASGAPVPPLNPADPGLRQFLSDHARTVALLRQATSMPDCYFERTWGRPGLDMLLPELILLRDSAVLLALDARVKAAEGKAREVLADTDAIFRLADHTRGEPPLVGVLVAMAADGIGYNLLEALLADKGLGPADLALLQITDAPHRVSVMRAFLMEEAFGLSCFAMLADRPEALWDFSGQGGAGVSLAQPLMGTWRVFLMPEDLASYRRVMRRLQDAAAKPHFEYVRARQETGGDLCRGDYGILTRMIVPALTRMLDKAAEADAARLTARAALAAAAYRANQGKLPARLDDLVPQYLDAVPTDPFDGKPIRMAVAATGVVFYSVGEDLKDDGGSQEADVTFRLAAD